MEGYKVISRLRKGKVLTQAHFGCLKGIPALNITSGCLFQCAYCYARGYSQAPKKGEVYLYTNLANLLEEELSKKRALPQWVILNTSSDCFQSHPDILNVTYRVIEILLDYGIGISFLTKGTIPLRFFNLFGRSREKIFSQIGIVSLSESYWKRYEPNTPPPERRLESIRTFEEIGIIPEVRIDPIIPFVTDTETEIKNLFGRLSEMGIKRVTLSYLHLRPAIERQLMRELSSLHQRLIESCSRTQEWKTVGSSTKTKLLPKTIREKGYKRIKEIAESFGITTLICQCKNPDLKGDLCGRINPVRNSTAGLNPAGIILKSNSVAEQRGIISNGVKVILGKMSPVQLPLFRC